MISTKTSLKLLEIAMKGLIQNQFQQHASTSNEQAVPKSLRYEDNKLITEAELKEKLKLSSPTLWRWRRNGMPYIKKGKKIYYEFNNVVKYMGGQRNDR